MVLNVVRERSEVGRVASKPGTGIDIGIGTVMPPRLGGKEEATTIRTDAAEKQKRERLEA